MDAVLDFVEGDQIRVEQELPGPETIEKRLKIISACDKHDVPQLASLATSRGVWLMMICAGLHVRPILLGSDGSKDGEATLSNEKELPPHKDEDQIQLDVNRAFCYYPKGQTELELAHRKDELSHLITTVLRRYPSLCYFQGYHDIAQVLLLVLERPALTVPALERVSLFRIRDYMLPSLAPSLKHLDLITAILYRHDRELCRRVAHTQPYFALAATLTLYAHDIERYGDIVRLFDFILSHEPVVTVYLYAAIVTTRRAEILAIPPSEPEMIHFTLSKLPQPLDLEGIIERTMVLYAAHPPKRLPYACWKKVSKYSVLKTSRNIVSARGRRNCAEGEALFREQMKELAREEWRKKSMRAMWKYRRQAGSLALAVAVGLLSYWMMRHNDGSGTPAWKRLYGLFSGRLVHIWKTMSP